MKTYIKIVPVLLLLIMLSCEDSDNVSMPTINGLSLYWDHEIFGEEGRRLRFEVSSTNRHDNKYELEFNTSIIDKSIIVRLVRSIDKGACPYFPMPIIGNDDPKKCNATGGFYLSDKQLVAGTYSLSIITPDFEVTSNLIITDEKITLEIPANEYLTSSIEHVYPVPQGLLFGSVFYQGSNNTTDAQGFLDELTKLGLTDTNVPAYNYRHLSVDDNGYPLNSNWEPDNHLIGFLYKINSSDFETIFEESKKYFNNTNLNIYLYSSNGDEASMSKLEGINVVYAK